MVSFEKNSFLFLDVQFRSDGCELLDEFSSWFSKKISSANARKTKLVLGFFFISSTIFSVREWNGPGRGGRGGAGASGAADGGRAARRRRRVVAGARRCPVAADARRRAPRRRRPVAPQTNRYFYSFVFPSTLHFLSVRLIIPHDTRFVRVIVIGVC